MRVGFDVLPLVRPFPPGVVRAVKGTLEALERRGNLEVVRLECRRHPWRGVWTRNDGGTIAGLAGIHSFTSGIPWRHPGRVVQTIHEAPWRHGVRENAGVRHRLWALAGPLLADRVVCPTERVRSDLWVPRWRGAERLRVVPWGVGPPFVAEAPPGVDDGAVVARRVPDLDGHFVLGLGVTRPKKDLVRLLAGIEAAGERARLSILATGPRTPELERIEGFANRAGIRDRFHHLDFVPEDELPSFLRAATAVSVLSRSEGFGFPALEALACGTVPLVRAEGAAAEVAGAAGIAVDPEDPAAVAEGLMQALDEADAREARIARAAEYSWDRTAHGIEVLWRELT